MAFYFFSILYNWLCPYLTGVFHLSSFQSFSVSTEVLLILPCQLLVIHIFLANQKVPEAEALFSSVQKDYTTMSISR